jgi:hypothetical protein
MIKIQMIYGGTDKNVHLLFITFTMEDIFV